MNFSEQLKKAKEKAVQEQNVDPQKEINAVVDTWYINLKDDCMAIAEKGGAGCRSDLHRYIEYLDNCYTCKQIKQEDVEEHFIAYRDDLPEARHWEKVRSLFFHYAYGEEYRTETHFFHYPYIFGVDKDTAEHICTYIKKKFKADGLEVKPKVIKWQQLRRIEERYIEYSQIDKWFTGENGRYKKVPVDDIEVFNVYIEIFW